ncbi:MAG: CHAT domain-containing protein [Caldilineaceae bacterium]|nr:CHAT domain-containing protein [Caldilineaceae bacterium]
MSSTMLDFDLQFSASADGYSVRLVNSSRGSLPGQPFVLPFSQAEMTAFVDQLLVAPNRQSSLFQGRVKSFGGKLYDALFTGELRVSLGRCLDEARAQGVPLRIKLRLHEAPELAALPWEFLYHASRDKFLVLDMDTPLVHSLELAEAVSPIAIAPPLRILAIFSNPPGAGPPLNVEAEWQILQESLADLGQRVVVERLAAPTLPALQRALSRQEPHILHFVGHGLFEDEAGGGMLLFEDERGDPALVEAERLGRLLANVRNLRLAVLNACEGGRTSASDPFAGVAQTLLRQGIPAVIAMQFPISDTASLTFSHEFYASLADGHPLDRALTGARLAIYTRHGSSEWATPRLFMHAADGVLWRMDETAQRVEEASADADRTRAGLNALAALMQKPIVRDAVVAFQTDLEATGQQIELLAGLKDLHDHLHNVEFQCYRMIEGEMARFPADDLAVENLLDNELTLQDLVEKVRQSADRAVLSQDTRAWINDLAEARRLLRAALQGKDPQSLAGCMRLLRRILTKEPSRINERLNRTAGSLRLGPIESTLTIVAEQLTTVEASVDPEALRQLAAGVEALGRLAQTLAQTVRDHNLWQNLDVELRRVDAVLVHDLDELIFSWPDVRRMAADLRRDTVAPWAETLAREEEQLDAALQSLNLALVRRCFFRFRRQAGIRFYQVDAELKNLCGEVARIAAPLDSILRLLG